MDSSTQAAASPNPRVSSSQIVGVVVWLLAASFLAATATRLGTEFSMGRVFSVDDCFIVGATILGVGQTISTFIFARIGWSDTLRDPSDAFQKAFYVSELLYLPTVCLAKLSALYSLRKISPLKKHTQPILGLMGAIYLLLVTFEIAATLQCSKPHWNILSGQCFNQSLFWKIFGAFDIVTDVWVTILPMYVVWNLQMASKVKIIFVGAFGSRVCTITATICRLVYLSRAKATVFDFWTFILCTEIEQGLSIITACIPFLKPFFESLESGMLATSNTIVLASGVSKASQGRRSALGPSPPTLDSMDKKIYRGTASTDSESGRLLKNQSASALLHHQNQGNQT